MSYESYPRHKLYFVYMRISKWIDDPNWYKWSLHNQEDICLKIAKNLQIPNENVILVQEDISWFKAKKRPKFEAMMSKLEADWKKNESPDKIFKRKYWWILFLKVDRLARNYEEFERIDKLFNAWYELISATETIENTPTWRLLLRMLAWFAIYESEKLSNRQTLAQLMNLVKWKFSSLWWSIPSYWYHKTEKKEWFTELSVKEEEGNIIRNIYLIFRELYSQNWKKNYQKTKTIINNNFNLTWDKALTTRKITSIIKNITAIKYDWYFIRELSIRDKIIQNYISKLQEHNSINADITWSVIIWGRIKFTFHLDEYVIMSPDLYESVQSILIKTQTRQKIGYWDSLSKLYSILFFLNKDNNEIDKITSKPYIKKEKLIYFRTDGRDYSEQAILRKFFTSHLCNKLKQISEHRDYFFNWYMTVLKSKNSSDLAKIKGRLLWRKREYNELKRHKEDLKWGNFSKHMMMEKYRKWIEELVYQERQLENGFDDETKKIISILVSNDISSESWEIQKYYFSLIFTQIILDSDWYVEFILNPVFEEKLSLSDIKKKWKVF